MIAGYALALAVVCGLGAIAGRPDVCGAAVVAVPIGMALRALWRAAWRTGT